MKKRKPWLLISIFIVLLLGTVVIVGAVIKYKKIPYVAFICNHRITPCLYICKNGDVYASTSEELFTSDMAEIEQIRRNGFADSINYVGSTNAREVCHMYDLFSEVVLDEQYRVNDMTDEGVPERRYNPKTRHWYGVHLDENGNAKVKMIYISDDDHECSDKRAYEIVDWMFETLKDYMK